MKFQRPGITARLFLAVLATATLVALAVGAAAQWSFQRGFIGYLNEQAVLRMEAVLPRVQQAYAERGDWAFVRDRPEVWFDLIGVGPRHLPPEAAVAAGASAPPAGASSARPPVADEQFRLIATDLLGAGRRLGLLDAQRQHVMGFPFILAGTEEREVLVQGRTVGWLTLAPVQTVTDEAVLRFLGGQWRATLGVGLVSVGLAALIAWWVTSALLAPVRQVAAATHDLAAGAWDTRVPVRGHDEVAQLAQDFNQLAHTLQRNEQVRRQYMADVSHELRTPLAVLRGELEALEDGVHQPTPEHLRLLQDQVATLNQLVDDLHQLALADVGALNYRKDDLDLTALMTHELSVLEHRAQARGLAVRAELPDTPMPVHGDEGRLRQLLHNVFANSVRYTDEGGQIRVRLQAEGDDAVIDLQDSAPGVPDELLPRLFDRFFRVQASRERAKGGSGLGLAICRSIAQAHGGSIEALPSPLGGLWVRIRLPQLRRAEVAA